MTLLLLLTAPGGGTYVHTFLGFAPAGRSDGQVWTQVMVEESTSRSGPWTELVTADVDPVDRDPENPQPRDITVNGAALEAGWYRITWIDADGNLSPSSPVFAGSATRPSVQEVANLMPDRTTVDGGTEARTFNTLTSPTAEEVEGLIDMVLDSVDPRVPDGASAEVERAARHVVTLNTAMLVESGNWGDQIETNEARVALWERLLAAHEVTLDAAANQNEAGGARYGSVQIVSPTLSAYSTATGWDPAGLLP